MIPLIFLPKPICVVGIYVGEVLHQVHQGHLRLARLPPLHLRGAQETLPGQYITLDRTLFLIQRENKLKSLFPIVDWRSQRFLDFSACQMC